jgi:hypothetical protein
VAGNDGNRNHAINILWAFLLIRKLVPLLTLISLAHAAGDTHTHTHVAVFTRRCSLRREIIHHPFLCHYADKIIRASGRARSVSAPTEAKQLTIHLAPKYKHKEKRRRLIEAANLWLENNKRALLDALSTWVCAHFCIHAAHKYLNINYNAKSPAAFCVFLPRMPDYL